MSLKLNISNRFKATRPAHYMGKDVRKWVENYETAASACPVWVWALALGFITACALAACVL